MTRNNVYRLIDGEREYQNIKWNGVCNDKDWIPNDWLVFIERYVKEGRASTGYKLEQMDAIRKIAALAVAAMEHNNTLPRTIPKEY